MRTPSTKQLSGALGGVALGGLIAGLTPVWGAHRLVTGVRTARSGGSVSEIERVSTVTTSLDDLMERKRPAIITDLVGRVEFRHRPDVAGLRELATLHDAPFAVKHHKRHSPYFLYVGDYGAELDRVERLTLDEFLDLMFVQGHHDDTCTYRLFSVKDLDGAIGEIVDDITTEICRHTERRVDRHASAVWIGSQGVVTPLHHDAWTGVLMQVQGTKRVAMYSPTDRANLSFVSPFSPTGRWSNLPARSAEASLDEHPRLARAVRYEAELAAGEALFIPPFWAHEVEALEANISIPFRFSARPVDHLNPGFLRPAVEIFHHKYVASRN